MRKSVLAAALVAVLGIAPAGACGLHGTIDNPFDDQLIPGSLGVALVDRRSFMGSWPPCPKLTPRPPAGDSMNGCSSCVPASRGPVSAVDSRCSW